MTDYNDSLVKAQLTLISKIAELEGSTLAAELDRLLPIAPVKSGVDFYKGYSIDQFECGYCHRPIGDELMTFAYCPGCGRKVERHD